MLKFILLTLCLYVFSMHSLANDVSQMIKNADAYRLDTDFSKVVALVKLYRNEVLDKTRQYNVYTRPERESLVVFKSPVEAGQKMLMLDDNYWLVMPKSRRPIRITPMQKLLGEASVGDISTLTWSGDYSATLTGHEALTINGQSVQTNLLSLKSVTQGAGYGRIELWLAAKTDFPLKAELYLRSGKLAKQALFEQGEREGRLRVVSMTLLDKIQPTKKTVIEYQQITSHQLADKFYIPAFLTRNALSEL
ncbi:outer membrane lipoprotein-sorting protein [Microbulbifer sp. 2304DJ12-6]|uniref:outer membrane lipoprotein-sorting protein n=1 Tax=Microbulbifer sp. 2304DJ12-6 TaxID=3233340 RepID=UPI0039B0F25A